MLSAAAAKLLGAMFKIPLTNILGGVGMSYFSCAYSLFMPVYALIVTGISSSVARMTARSAAQGRYADARKIRRTALLVFTAAGLPGSLLMIILAKPFSMYSVNTPEAAPAVAMIAPAVLFGCITAVERGYYEGMSNMYPTAVSQVIEGIVKVFAGLWLCGYVNKNSEAVTALFPEITDIRAAAAAAGILGVTLSSVGASAFFGLIRLHAKKHSPGASTLTGKVITGELLRTALPIGISAVVTNLTALIDMWTVMSCLDADSISLKVTGISPDELPQFVYGSFSGIALTVFNLVPSVTNMLGKSALTCAASARECGDAVSLRKSSMQALLTSAIMAVPAAAGLAAIAPDVLGFLFPRQSEEVAVCVNSLRLLMPGMVCLCVSFPLFSMLQAIGKASLPLKIMLIGAVVKSAGNLLLIPPMGVDGAAVSTSLCYVLILILSVRAYMSGSGVRLDIFPFLKVIYAGAMCGGGALLASQLAMNSGAGVLVRIGAAILTGGVLYIGILLTLMGKKSVRAEAFRE